MSLSEYPCPLDGLGSLIQVLEYFFVCVSGSWRGLLLEEKKNSREIIRKRHQRKSGLPRLLPLETASLNYSEPLTQ